MTKQQFIDSLQWVVGQPKIVYTGSFLDEERPLAIETNDGHFYIMGHVNLLGGVCDDCQVVDENDIVRYAYLYEDDK